MKDHIISAMKNLETRRIYLCRLRFRPSQNDDEQSTLYKRVYEGVFVEMRCIEPCDSHNKKYIGEWKMQFTNPNNNWVMLANTGEMWMPSGDLEFLDNRLIYDLMDDFNMFGFCHAHDDVMYARAYYMLKDVIGKDNVAPLLRETCRWMDVTYGSRGD